MSQTTAIKNVTPNTGVITNSVSARAMTSKWYEKSYKRILVDMHIPDWDPRFFSELDPDKYAQMMELSGIDTAIIYAASCLGICNWPTKHGHMHKQLHGRDILKEMIAACRKKNLNIIVYFNIWSRWAYDTHPQWRIVLPNGKGTVEDGGRFGLCCHNTGYHDYVLAMIDELCSNYEAEGLWVDMIGWFSKICYCHGCRDRFLRETGHELPREINWHHPVWVSFQRKREEWLADFAQAVVATAKKARPGISVALQNTSMLHSWAGGVNQAFTQQGDYLAGDFYGGVDEQSFVCKLLNCLSKNHPIEFMTPRCETLAQHTTSKPYANFLMQAYASLANNACFVLIDAIDPVGTLNRKFYEQARGLFDEVKRYEEYLDPQAKLLADVAIYFSFESMINTDFNGRNTSQLEWDPSAMEKMKNMVKALSQHHIPFTFITEKHLDRLSDYQVVILSDVSAMDKYEVESFKKYVAGGGNIFASMETSLGDKAGTMFNDFQLADVFGVSYQGTRTDKISYLYPVHEATLLGDVSKAYPLMLASSQLAVKAACDTQVDACTALPYTNPQDPDRFASAISNPPGIYTTQPALTRHQYGNGTAVYCAGDIESLAFEMHRQSFVNIIQSLLGNAPVFTTNAPSPVEITLFLAKNGNRLVINLLNYQSELPPIPVRDINVTLALGGRKPVTLFKGGGGKEKIPFKQLGDGRIEFTIERLNMFEMFVLEYH